MTEINYQVSFNALCLREVVLHTVAALTPCSESILPKAFLFGCGVCFLKTLFYMYLRPKILFDFTLIK